MQSEEGQSKSREAKYLKGQIHISLINNLIATMGNMAVKGVSRSDELLIQSRRHRQSHFQQLQTDVFNSGQKK